MFTARFHRGRPAPRSSPRPGAGEGDGSGIPLGEILRFGAFCALLALGLPRTAAAQAIGTMQVSARVVPAAAAWTGLGEAGLAARMAAARGQDAGPLVRETGVVRTRAEIHRSGDQGLVLVTVQHLRN